MKFFEKLLFEPDSKSYTSGNDYNVLPVEVRIPSGLETLNGWWFGAEFPKAILIQFHGNAENITSHAPYVAWLAEHGISVLCFDYSGYGKSTGKPSIVQVRLDCDAALAFVQNKCIQIARPLIVLGQSIGSQFALSALARANCHPQLVVLEGAFPSIQALVRSKLPSFFPLNFFADSIARQFPASEDAASAIPKLKSRFLVIHSLTDQVVKLDLGKQLSRLIHANSQDLWIVDGPKHLKTFTSE